MNNRMTWQEIKNTYPDQWVGMTDMEWVDGQLKSAVVKYTDKSGNELIGMQLDDPENFYCSYTTPDNVPFIFSAWGDGGR